VPDRPLVIRWLKRALANLDAEAAFIALDNSGAAARVVDTIARTVELLAQHPGLGRPGRVEGTRELVVANTPYLVPYRVRNDVVEIFRVFHSARKWPQKF
jgi:toxin ParE1/3/4